MDLSKPQFTEDTLALQHMRCDGPAADFIRCKNCHFLERADFIGMRIKAGRPPCRRCLFGTEFYEPTFITDKERKRIINGFYREPVL